MTKGLQLLATFLIAIGVLGLFQSIGSNARVDLTENNLYTLADGTQALVDGLERPVTLKLFFSEDGTQEIVRLRQYAKRVNELLTEIQALNPDKVSFEQIDPEPFSEAEDEAAAYGLTAAPIAPGQSIYFGLVAVPTSAVTAVNADDTAKAPEIEDQSTEILPFLQPDRESFLEYDIAQLVHKVGNPKKPTLGLMTGLEVQGGFDMMSRQPKQPWLAVQQMESLYDVQTIPSTANELPADLDVLVLIQPEAPSDSLLYSIDQFALGGGRILAFIDPLANSNQPNPMGGGEVINGADWNRLFRGWGVELNPGQVVGDMNLALMVNQAQGQQPVRHIAIQNYPESNIARTPFTGQINQINMATVGEWRSWSPGQGMVDLDEGSGDTLETAVVTPDEVMSDADQAHYKALKTEITPLITTTQDSGLIAADVFVPGADIADINNQFRSDGETRNVAIMIAGTAVSVFPAGPPQLSNNESESESESAQKTTQPAASVDHLASGDVNAVLIADTDLLTDYLWVQVMGQFRGQSIAQPFADNGDFLLNALEHVSGNKALMSIRSRGTYSRPFTRVEELRLVAEQRFREQEQELNQRLEETEAKLAELQPSDQETLELTAEQQAALLDFQQERLSIRKALRNVNLQLNQDIKALGLKVKALNIFLMPFLLFVFAVFFFSMRQKQMERAKVSFVHNQ